MGQVARLEGTTSLSSKAGGVVKGGSAGYSNLHHELLQTPHHPVQRHRAANLEVLVGPSREPKENTLVKMEHALPPKGTWWYGVQGITEI